MKECAPCLDLEATYDLMLSQLWYHIITCTATSPLLSTITTINTLLYIIIALLLYIIIALFIES